MPTPERIDLHAHPDALYLFGGETLLSASSDGVIDHLGGTHGLYHQNTRIISHWTHHIDGQHVRYAAASAVSASAMLGYYQAKNLQQHVGGIKPEEPGVIVRVSRIVGDGMHEDIDIENYSQREIAFTFACEVQADFADLEEARAGERKQEAPVRACRRLGDDGRSELLLSYDHPDLQRAVAICFRGDQQPRFDEGRVLFDLTIEPRGQRQICVAFEPEFDGERKRPTPICHTLDGRSPEQKRYLASMTRLDTPVPGVERAWDTARQDLADLALRRGTWPQAIVPAAGVPNYQSLFGRDAITAAFQSLMLQPVLVEATVETLIPHIGKRRDDTHDEQPGRIVQQMNNGPLATLGITPFHKYYGDYASPPALLIAIAQHFMWTGETAMLRRHYDDVQRVLEWLARDADLDGDGFIEYKTRAPNGQRNQGWKDSGVAVVDDNGNVVEPPIAACELQGYLYAAKQQYAIALAAGMHKFSEARTLLSEASTLKRRFDDAFWMPPERFLAFALGADKQPLRSIASNAGHCLATGIVDARRAEDVAKRLLAPDMFSGWGVRTLSSDHPSYNPLGYQLGSVWPVENATIAFGLKRYGFHDLCNQVCKAVFDAARLFPHHRLPEVIGGYERDNLHPHPGLYPEAQSPQAWSASAIFLCVQAMLGLRPLAPLRLLLVDPVLPDWLPDVTLRNLHVGAATLDIRFHRERDGTTGWKVLRSQGSMRVVRQPPESSVTSSAGERVRDVFASFVPFLH